MLQLQLQRQRSRQDLVRWNANYGKLFGLKELDLSVIRIPTKPANVGPLRLIVVAHDILKWTDNRPLQGTQEALKEHFTCWQYASDLDKEITSNDRDLKNGSYAIWVRDVCEADKNLINLSAEDLLARRVTGIVTLERQLLEADYFFEKKEHLDQQSITQCSGSRYRGGGVPYAYCRGGRFNVGWFSPSSRNPAFRSRRVWA